MAAVKMKRTIVIFGLAWLTATAVGMANPVRKTISVGGFEREYLIYTPQHPHSEKAKGLIVCLHGFGRTMNDFFETYDISSIADSLNLIVAVPQALPEQNKRVKDEATIISWVTNNRLSLHLHSVWGCGLGVRVTGLLSFNEVLNKDMDDVGFLDAMIDEVLSEHAMQNKKIFLLGTSMGGYMAYQFALKKGGRLSGIITIAASMGLNIEGMNEAVKIPVCDFHSITDEVVPYAGSRTQLLYTLSLAKPKSEVIDFWTKTNATEAPVVEQIHHYPSTNGITVEKITYPDPENEVIHYKINGASHGYFFKKEVGDCMDHIEEITRFITAHLSVLPTPNAPFITEPQPLFYPNPVTDRIYFNVPDGIISIYDMTGRKLLTRPFTNAQTDLSPLKPGLYILHLQSANTTRTGKLIKKQ